MKDYFWEKEGIVLRVFEKADDAFLYEMLQDSKARIVCDHGMSLPYGIKDASSFRSFTRECIARGDSLCLAISDSEDDILGYVNLSRIDERAGFANLTIYVRKKCRKQGVGSIAAEIMLSYAFDERRLHKVNTSLPKTATESCKFVEKIGFQKEFEKKESYYINGNYVNEICYGINENIFRNMKEHSIKKTEDESAKAIGRKSDSDFVSESELCELDEELLSSSYWNLGDCFLRPILEEECAYNHELVYESDAYRFYENTVGLPFFSDEPDDQEMDCLYMDVLADRILFAIEDTEGNYVGNVQLHSIDRRHGSFSFSFFTRKEFRGKGYATKALEKVIGYAFEELRLHKCDGLYNLGNEASKRVMEKLGLAYEGTKKEVVFYKGKYIDAVCMGITADDWKNR